MYFAQNGEVLIFNVRVRERNGIHCVWKFLAAVGLYALLFPFYLWNVYESLGRKKKSRVLDF